VTRPTLCLVARHNWGPPQGDNAGAYRQLARTDVEAVALRVYRWREHQDDVDPHGVTGQRAAELLGVNVTRLNQLATRRILPFETTAGGNRLTRREQLRVVAHARNAWWARYHVPRVASPKLKR
jgi:hypothetical protein